MNPNDNPPEIKSFEALGVLLWSMNSRLAELEKTASQAATHADVSGLRQDVAGLMRRQETIERDLLQAKEEWKRSKPATLFSNAVRLFGGLAVIFSFVALMWQVADALTAVKRAALSATQQVAPK